MVHWTSLSITVFIGINVIVGTNACLSEDDYEALCASTFMNLEREGLIYNRLCGPDEDGVYLGLFNCIKTQSNCPYRNQAVEIIFNAVFPGNDLNLTCEIVNNQECQSVPGCFYSSFNYSNANNVVVGYYDFFCGPDYLQKGYSCLKPIMCPFSSAKAQGSMVFVLGDRAIDLAALRAPVEAVCSNLTDLDRSCIRTNTDSLNNCGITPLISTSPTNAKLTCSSTDTSKSCIAESCSERVANVFLDMFGLLTCNRVVVCTTVYEDDILWMQAYAGQTFSYSCPRNGTTGNISRTCNAPGTWGEIVNTCQLTDEGKQQILDELGNILSTSSPDLGKKSDVLDEVDELLDTGKVSADADTLVNVLQLQDAIIDQLVDLTADNVTNNTTEKLLDTFVKSVNTIVKPENEEVWKEVSIDETADATPSWVLDITEKYVDVVQDQKCGTLGSSGFEKSEDYVYVAVDQYDGEIKFPSTQAQQSNNQIDLSTVDVTIPAQTISNKGVMGPVCAGGSYFTTLGQYLDNEEIVLNDAADDGDGDGDDDADADNDDYDKLVVNSNIVSLNFKDIDQSRLDPPAVIRITPKRKDYTDPQCAFWDFNLTTSNSRQRGSWSTEGCELVSFEDNMVICQCSHLTNFCVLMSPKSLATIKALNIISAVGCGISIVCLLLTIICHMVVWRLVRSDRATILMNLCVALLLALVTFLVGVERVESRVACTAIAAIIQFLFLAVFFLMFLMGVEILICVVHVFGTKFRIKVLLPLTWGAAAVVVGVSLGVTKTEGYGNDKFCWLDTESGLIWAFIGPAAFVIIANFLVMIVVFKKMSTSNVLKSKSSKEKAITAGKSLCVLLPLMGVTWVFGLLALNEDSTVMAYLFCIVNSLQGLFIFLFHCVFNRQIKDAWEKHQARKKSLQTFSSDFRNKSKEGQHSNTFDSPEKKDKETPSISNEHVNNTPRRKGRIDSKPEDDWMKAERKQYHKDIRKGNIYGDK